MKFPELTKINLYIAGLEIGENKGKASLALNVAKLFRASRPVCNASRPVLKIYLLRCDLFAPQNVKCYAKYKPPRATEIHCRLINILAKWENGNQGTRGGIFKSI